MQKHTESMEASAESAGPLCIQSGMAMPVIHLLAPYGP